MNIYAPRGIEIAADILSRSQGKLLVYFDPDVDGLFSGVFVCRFLDAFGKPYDTYINENRQHGFLFEDLESLRGRTVIAVDFAITPEKMEALRQHEISLINIDHHSVDGAENLVSYAFDGSPHASGIVINNQYPFEPEECRFLSGAGVVHAVLSHLLVGFDTQLTRGLVGLTLLSDIRALENPIAEEYLRACYTCRDPYMRHLIDITRAERDYGFGVPMMERNYVDYTFSPKFNALFRLNMGTQAIKYALGAIPEFDLDQARVIQNQVRDYIKENLKNPFDTNKLLFTATSGIVDTQKAYVQDGDSPVIYTSRELESLNILYIEDVHISDDYKLTNFIGLTCSQIKSFGRSAVVYVGTPDRVLRGSFRGRFDSVKYLAIFQKHGFRCAGHENAFGILECDLRNIDFEGLSNEIKAEELIAEKTEYANRIKDVSDLKSAISLNTVKTIAMTNIYVRDSYRIYLRYTGSNVRVSKLGKMWEHIIDGIRVKCFDEGLTVKDGYILPIYDRGTLTFYLKNIKK